MAVKLDKELCLFANYTTNNEKKAYEQLINNYATTIRTDLPNLPISTLIIEGKLKELVLVLSDNYEAIMFFCGCKLTKHLLTAFYNSKIPFFFSKYRNNNTPTFNQLLIPIDYRKNTKQALLWGSYMGRFANSTVNLLPANDSDSYNNEKVNENIAFAHKLYSQFTFNYTITKGT